MNLFIDFETYNTQDIRLGTYRYAETAEVLLTAYAIDAGPVKVWDRSFKPKTPDELALMLADPDITITAHNSNFDRTVMRLSLGIETDIRRWRCTMVQAMLHGFPGGLDDLCKILDLPQDKAKLSSGKKLIHRFCKPAPASHKADRYDRHSHPKEWEEFKRYAALDIDAMREVSRRLPTWNCKTWDEWHLDQEINDRGFAVDLELTKAGMGAAASEKEMMSARFKHLTRGMVHSPTQRAQFMQFLNAQYGLKLGDTQKATLTGVLGTLDDTGNEIIALAMAANKTSTSKYKALHSAVSTDGRFRGGLQFSGAARTRRWSGRTFQPQNLPSRGLPSAKSVERFIKALKADCHDFLFEDVMGHTSGAIRGVLVAPPGRKLVISDLSNIEGRANAWLAGEKWKLDAFAKFDRGQGPDLYNVTAGSILGKRPDAITKSERNSMGKVPELALGYAGGFGAFQTFARAYGIKMTDYEEVIRASDAGKFLNQAEENWETWGQKRTPDADPLEWFLSEAIKLTWRKKHSRIADLWAECEAAARSAMAEPGEMFSAGPHLKFKRVKHGFNYLLCRLPSNRFLVYFDPKIVEDEDGNGSSITYMGVNQLTRQWQRLGTYGGKFVENACQSLSRDILCTNMRHVQDAGYDIVLTVHDEVVTEANDTPAKNVDEVSALLATVPAWARGFPLAAAGFEANRYRKE